MPLIGRRAPFLLTAVLLAISLAALGCMLPEPASTPRVPTTPAEEISAPGSAPPSPAPEEAPPPAPEETPSPARGGARTLRDVPDHFLTIAPSGAAREPSGGNACPGQVLDPRFSAPLRLVRSRGGLGDYEVPPGRYGVGDGELLRIECGSGRAVAIVAR